MIQSKASRQFRKLYLKLSPEVRREADRAYKMFRVNPAHPGLQFKQIEGHSNIYSARVGLRHRALGAFHAGVIVWIWIGTHGDYDKLV